MHEKEKSWLLQEKHHGVQTPQFFADVSRIESGEPVDYLIGFSSFLGIKIDLVFRPLIPRTETEWWVDKAIQTVLLPSSPTKKDLRVLDLFSGSGCIGIAVAKNIPKAFVDFGEKNKDFVAQIQKNIEQNELPKNHVHVFMSDVFEKIPRKSYDFIFANPPYIAREKISQVEHSVLRNEPHEALFAEDNGLFFIKKLVKESGEYLSPGGKMFIEFDSCQKEEIEKLLADTDWENEFWKDQFEKWRVVILTKKM